MLKRIVLLLAALALAGPAMAGAGNFILVNGTGADLTDLSIRRTGTNAWAPLVGRAPQGVSSPIKFSDVDCAFDIRAKVSGGADATWSGLNLCEVSRVTLRRAASGTTFASYD